MNDRSAALQERYEELRTLGRGGSGTVYLVRDGDTGERLALKRLLRADEESLMRLKREFHSLAGISHPNLVKLYDLKQDATSALFAMEYLAGEDSGTSTLCARGPLRSPATSNAGIATVASCFRVGT
jgi:serine/threonine protein kinase